MEPVNNILSVDVEDWYMDTDSSNWNTYEDRIVSSTEKILSLLEEAHAKATFFILGYVAESHPELVEHIFEKGHEIATHGYSHKPITKLHPLAFEDDLLKSVRALQNITKEKIKGYRACQFSLCSESSWALDILIENGFRYDSSIFPVKTPLYGVPKAPLFPYHISSSDLTKADESSDFLEFPLSIYRIPFINFNIPIAGGFYLRLFPYCFIKRGIDGINRAGKPGIIYVHPWEFDVGQPVIKNYPWYRYYNLSRTERKFCKLLKDFKFTSIEDYLHNHF